MLQSATQPVQMPATPVANLPLESLKETKDSAAQTFTLSGLVLSEDTQVLCVLERALDRFKIETTVAIDREEASQQLASSKFDVVIIDFENPESAEATVRELRASKFNRECSVIAIASNFKTHQAAFKCGANFTVPRLRTADEATRCIRSSYFLILRNKRASVRFPLSEIASVYRNGEKKSTSATIKNLSETGLRLKCSAALSEGEIIEIDFQLANGRVNGKVQVVWVNDEGEAGCKFTTLESGNLKAVQEWINIKLLGRLQ